MAQLNLQHLDKIYDNKVQAVRHVHIEVEYKEIH